MPTVDHMGSSVYAQEKLLFDAVVLLLVVRTERTGGPWLKDWPHEPGMYLEPVLTSCLVVTETLFRKFLGEAPDVECGGHRPGAALVAQRRVPETEGTRHMLIPQVATQRVRALAIGLTRRKACTLWRRQALGLRPSSATALVLRAVRPRWGGAQAGIDPVEELRCVPLLSRSRQTVCDACAYGGFCLGCHFVESLCRDSARPVRRSAEALPTCGVHSPFIPPRLRGGPPLAAPNRGLTCRGRLGPMREYAIGRADLSRSGVVVRCSSAVRTTIYEADL